MIYLTILVIVFIVAVAWMVGGFLIDAWQVENEEEIEYRGEELDRFWR